MIDTWKKYEFSDCLVDNNVGRANQINASEIKKEGRFPVVDQGQDFIAGYSDEENKLVKNGLPYVIFGDHTRSFKFVDFPFIVGADGTKVLSPNKILFDPRYFYFQLLSFDIPSRGYNRHYKSLKEKVLQKPELPEQRKIAYVLSTVQNAIEQQDKHISHTTELKKALMQKLFTEGTKGEKQKQTEIGLVPGSWVVENLGLHSNIVTSFPTFAKASTKYSTKEGKFAIHYLQVSDMNLEGNEISFITSNNTFYTNGKADFNSGFIKPASIVFPKRGAAIATNKKRITTKHSILDPNLIGVEPFEEVNIKFLYYFFETFDLASLQDNNVIPQLNKHNVAGVKFPLPKIQEQELIVKTIDTISQKVNSLKTKKHILSSLFKTLLNELMTGERRVDEIKFEKQLEVV